MNTLLLTLHILLTVTLVALILLQNSKGGLTSGALGGEFYRSRRGAEKISYQRSAINQLSAISYQLSAISD